MKHSIIFLSILSLVIACQKTDLPLDTNMSTNTSFNNEVLFQYSVIGERHPNPLSIDNMKRAFENLDPMTKSGFTVDDIISTHKYVAFTPTNEDELYALENLDENVIVLSSYPFDYYVSDGLIVPDARFMTNGYSYRWAYVPIDFDLSTVNCPYVYYYDIFSPDNAFETRSGASFSSSLFEAIEKESYKLCGMEIDPIIETKAKVTPSGRIRFYDDDFNDYRGVDGLSIRTVRGTHSSYTHCDANGNFTSSDSFRYSFSYEIHFSRTDFVIRKNGTTDEIILKYSGYKGPIYKDFNDDESTFYATLSRAAIVYYYGDNCGLRRPPMKNDNTARLAIQAQLGEDSNAYGQFYVNNRWILSDRPKLNIYRKSNSSLRANIDVYATTMHELSHASHWRNNQSRFKETENNVLESFARGVQWILTKSVYPDYVVPFYYRQSYAGVVQDLIDGYGTKKSSYYAIWVDGSLTPTYSYKAYSDHVTGFTPTQIEEAVRKSRTWDEWKNNIINDNPDIASSSDISAAFSYWNSAN